MNHRMKLDDNQTRESAFTLLELLVSVSIISVLAVLAVPNIQSAWIRSNVCKVVVDMNNIKNALGQYYADYSDYPNTQKIISPSSQIQELPELVDPYLSPAPHFPWEGQMSVSFVQETPGVYVHCPQGNYAITRRTSFKLSETRHLEQLGWYLDSGGPISCCPSSDPITWYAPTNGLLSRGGFIMNSLGLTNCY